MLTHWGRDKLDVKLKTTSSKVYATWISYLSSKIPLRYKHSGIHRRLILLTPWDADPKWPTFCRIHIQMNETCCNSINIFLFDAQGSFVNMSSLISLMAWRRFGNRPLLEQSIMRLPRQLGDIRPHEFHVGIRTFNTNIRNSSWCCKTNVC